MRDKWTSSSSTGNGLQDGCFNLEVTFLVEEIAHCVYNLGALDKGVHNVIVDNKVNVTLTVTLFRVTEGIEYLAILFLYYWQRPQGLCQNGKLLDMNCEFTGLSNKGKTFYTNNITYIEKFLKDGIVQSLVFARTDIIPFNVNLNSAC